jgi:hypothetical protein
LERAHSAEWWDSGIERCSVVKGIRNLAEGDIYESNQDYRFINSFIGRKLGTGAERRGWRGWDRSRGWCWNGGWRGSNAGNFNSFGSDVDAGQPAGNDFDAEFAELDAFNCTGLEFSKAADAWQYHQAIDDGAEYDSGNFSEWVALGIAAWYSGRSEWIRNQSGNSGYGVVCWIFRSGSFQSQYRCWSGHALPTG